jgi:hypothetical protein
MLMLAGAVVCAARRPGEPLKPGFNLFSKQQDVELGQQAAQQVRGQYPVVQNQELQDYIRRVGEKLAAVPAARESGFQFTFTLLHQAEVNAFALPGGPTFVFTGLIKLADNEGELAGVLAHEISHVILRHGTNQASKANLLQLPAQLAGAMVGSGGMGQLVNLGLGVGLNGLFLKYSRTDETQADALGTRLLSEAGYNPIEMANLFEKLEGQGGSGGPQFLSSHPNPGNRVKAVEAEIQALPQRSYNAGTGQFARAKQLVMQLPPPPKAKQETQTGASAASTGAKPSAPSGFEPLATGRYSLEYPSGWRTLGDKQSSMITLAPREGLVQGSSGDSAIGYGAILSYYFPEQSGQDLQKATNDLIQRLRASNSGLRQTVKSRKVRVDGNQGLVTQLAGDSPFGGAETDMLVSVTRPEGLFYMIFVAPQQDWNRFQSAFDHMLESLRFAR